MPVLCEKENLMTPYSARNFPPSGWLFRGEKILPPTAFIKESLWLEYLAKILPEGEKILRICKGFVGPFDKIVEYSVFKLIDWLNKGEIRPRSNKT